MKDKLGIGIIGLGIISPAHERGMLAAADLADIVAVCDVDEKKAQSRAEPYAAQVYTDYHALLADPHVDLVDIILPHNLHYPAARAAIDAGKHVLIEKPLTIHSSDGADLIRRARQRGIVFSVAENTRFVTAYQAVEKILASGELGRILSIRTLISGSEIYRLEDTSTWKGKQAGSGGGVLMDAAPHTFYLLKWLFGEIDSLQAFSQKLVPQAEVEDNALVLGELKSGALFTCQFSFTTQSPWSERLEVNGEHASIVIDQVANPPGMLYHGTFDFHGHTLEIPYDPAGWKEASIAAEVASFIEAVWHGTPPQVDPADANYAVYAVEKAYQSIQENAILPL
jgi:predicted dehydrogenase